MEGKRPKIGFRVDAGNITGTGHLMEIISLIKSLRKRRDFYGVGIVNDHPLCKERLGPLVEDLKIIPDSAVGNNELGLIVSFLKEQGVTCLIMDLLNRTPHYYGELKKKVDHTYVILDNSIHEEIPASIVVNFNILQSPEFYKKVRSDTEYLIGPKYAILDESLYDNWSKGISFRDDVKRIFINQGGSDPYGLTAKTVKALERLSLEQEVVVVVGGAMKKEHREELDKLKSELKGNYSFFENISQSKVYELLSKSDMALTAAGNTLYELAFFGIPSLIICHHENHNKVAAMFAELGAGISLGIGREISETVISKAAKSLLRDKGKRRTLSENARCIVDGYGTGRLAERIVRDIKEWSYE